MYQYIEYSSPMWVGHMPQNKQLQKRQHNLILFFSLYNPMPKHISSIKIFNGFISFTLKIENFENLSLRSIGSSLRCWNSAVQTVDYCTGSL
jgi:hypothetical protein